MAGISKQQFLILAIMLFIMVSVIGCFVMVAAGKIVPF